MFLERILQAHTAVYHIRRKAEIRDAHEPAYRRRCQKLNSVIDRGTYEITVVVDGSDARGEHLRPFALVW